MSIEFGIRDKMEEVEYSIDRSAASFSIEVIPYFLLAFDASKILLAAWRAGGISYHLLIGDTTRLGAARKVSCVSRFAPPEKRPLEPISRSPIFNERLVTRLELKRVSAAST
jgi:hypothetical protein